jgi:hypothetical protein
MSNLNIFMNGTKSVPSSDEQIVRVSMEQIDLGGRKSHLPAQHVEPKLALSHVANASTMPGK